jgi:Tfp pilus assembly protein PilF
MTLDRMNAYYSLQLASYYLRGTPTTQTAKANAEGLLRHALDLDRFHYPRAYAMLAQLHVEAGRPDAAEEVFREAARTYGDLAVLVHNDILEARLWPAVAVLYVRRGELLITQGRTADAEDVLRSVIRVDGSQSLAYLRLADALRRAGRRAAAAAVLSEGLAKNPSSDVLWVAWRTFGGPRTAVYER